MGGFEKGLKILFYTVGFECPEINNRLLLPPNYQLAQEQQKKPLGYDLRVLNSRYSHFESKNGHKCITLSQICMLHIMDVYGMFSCLVLSCSDVEHAIWRHRGSVPPSGEMNGHQHNPLSAHVSWSQQNTDFFFSYSMNEMCFHVLLSDLHRG